jgi:hypothetical protein
MFGKFIAAATAALVGAAIAAAPASAFTGAEIRLSIWNGQAVEHHLWRLRPGGKATGISSTHYNTTRGYWHEEISDSGSWTYADGTLCVTWRRILHGGRHCYRLTINGTQLTATSVAGGRPARGTIHPLAR